MFRLALEPTFITDAVLTVPTDDGPDKQTMRARFRLLASDHPAQTVPDGGRAFLQAALIAVFDVADDAGCRLEDTPALREQLLDMAFVRTGLMAAYLRAASGAAAGN